MIQLKTGNEKCLIVLSLGIPMGFLEGLNHQSKVIKRDAFGFKRYDRLRLRVLLHHQYKNLDF
ncbi:transposase [Paraliobacillus ryukyuensis]|uniref:transposase n=1 Tax=Paraliobacillus ryukyuensis TaxID=200904 RepID=UPI00351CC80A